MFAAGGDPEHGVGIMGIRGHVGYLMIGNQNRLRDDLKAALAAVHCTLIESI